jgi:hypothetical protein
VTFKHLRTSLNGLKSSASIVIRLNLKKSDLTLKVDASVQS